MPNLSLKNNLIKLAILSSLLIPFKSYSDDYSCTKKRFNIIRSAPSQYADKIKVIPKYTPLITIDKINNWFEIQGHDFDGFIHKSLITSKYKCMTILKRAENDCIGKNKIHRNLKYKEGFKILKQEIGCNYVKPAYGRSFWISSMHIWPTEYATLIKIPNIDS
jgi:hypothetical protein